MSSSRQILARLRDQLTSDTSLSEPERNTLRLRIVQRERELNEMPTLEVVAPSVTFERELTLRLGARVVRLLHVARGNTPGDAVVWLSAEHIAAVGDLLVAPVPYAYNSVPHEWIRFLHAVDSLARASSCRDMVPYFTIASTFGR